MIFVDKSLEEWLKRYPGLKPFNVNCTECGKGLSVNRPFVEKGYAGIAVEECSCGKNRNRANCRVTTSPKTYSKWAVLINKFLGKE
jgi:hypothetical protein